MATIQNIPEDVLETHILPLATEQEKLREKIKDLEKEIEEIRNSLELKKKSLMEAEGQLENHHRRNRKNEKKLRYFKGQIDYLVSSSSNHSYSDDY